MRTLMVSLAFLAVFACASAPDVAYDLGLESYPKGWPQPVELDFDSDECISLEGSYRSGGESNSSIGERFSNPIFERNFFALDAIADAENIFKMTHEKSLKRYHFAILNSASEILASGIYKNYSRCLNGWVITESRVTGGSGDNPTRAQTEITLRFLAEDGSLIVRSRLNVKTSKLFVLHETETSEIWYRFEPVN